MKTKTELKSEGYRILIEKLGLIDAERFISMITEENFDYTDWQRHLWDDVSIDGLSKEAMEYFKNKTEKNNQ